MVSYYLDTSALAKHYLEEEYSESVDRILFEADQLITSSLTELEIFSTLERSKRGHFLNSPTYRDIISAFEKDLTQKITLIAMTPKILHEAKRLIRQRHLRAPDAIQLATALSAEKKFPQRMELLCFDKALLEAARLEGLKCVP